MPREACVNFDCWLLKDFCRLIWCPLCLFGANVNCCSCGLPPGENLWQQLALCFGYPHRKHLPVQLRPSKISGETDGAGSNPDQCRPLPDVLCLCDRHRPDLPPTVVSAGSEMDGWLLRIPALQDESIGCFCCCCCCCCCCCSVFLFSMCVTCEAVAVSKNVSKQSNLPQAGVLGTTLFWSVLWRPAQAIS